MTSSWGIFVITSGTLHSWWPPGQLRACHSSSSRRVWHQCLCISSFNFPKMNWNLDECSSNATRPHTSSQVVFAHTNIRHESSWWLFSGEENKTRWRRKDGNRRKDSSVLFVNMYYTIMYVDELILSGPVRVDILMSQSIRGAKFPPLENSAVQTMWQKDNCGSSHFTFVHLTQ